MRSFQKCLHLYIGCETNLGQLVGVRNNFLLIKEKDGQSISEYDLQKVGTDIFLHLQLLDDLTDEQRKEVINKGINIGRPAGYTFSNAAFLFLLSLNVDVFGLIRAGYARNINDASLQIK